MKTCSRCKQERPLEEFHKQRAAKDGHFPLCRVCVAARNKNGTNLNNETTQTN